ncbi:MAG: WecB/TagA/CpsF family glycosyltransferase [Chloroflexota bacterium]|nr:WecB/TagA/CpsF family glycosyltransferase [Chloroflexota bacterium]
MATEALVLGGPLASEVELLTRDRGLVGLRAQIELGGVRIDRVDLAGAVDRVRTLLRSDGAHQIVTVNLDFLSIARQNTKFRQTLNHADLAVADGMPLVWLSRLKPVPLVERVAGVELFSECCALAAEEGRSVFLLGAAPGVADKAAAVLQERFPGLQVAGTYSPPNGPLSRRETDRIVKMVRRAAPGFLFVALGAPRQDLWICDQMDRLNVPVSMGVGCVFDLVAGQVSRAPGWMRRMGLEWAYRLGHEPTRLWRRYLLNDLPLLTQLLWASLGEARADGSRVAVST